MEIVEDTCKGVFSGVVTGGLIGFIIPIPTATKWGMTIGGGTGTTIGLTNGIVRYIE